MVHNGVEVAAQALDKVPAPGVAEVGDLRRGAERFDHAGDPLERRGLAFVGTACAHTRWDSERQELINPPKKEASN